MDKYEINQILNNLNITLSHLEQNINLELKIQKISELSQLMEQSDFWNKNTNSVSVAQELHKLKNEINRFLDLKKRYDDLIILFELAESNEENQDFLFLSEELQKIKKDVRSLEIEILLNQPYDENNAILMLHSGAGGIESQDWCEILFRMYQKYAQKKNFKVEILHLQPSEEAGLKTVSLLIKGNYAYGHLKAEKGVHRLVRISPFDANARRHTSFASCDILPEINDEIKIDIREQDLRIDVFRSSGAGGQHVNTTDSAVRITHLPTNTVVNCQNERSQIKNREKALQILKTKLLQLAVKEQKEKEREFKAGQKDISWGSQIRSYIFHPYQMVKDHRTNYELSNISDVMDGNLDDFINAFLRKK
ncbi:peptide chain release factor 2 [Candidatus Phytoplasma melaleucae]|uniref:Peptide chain release factor 2 n=1 Tax=Candidatus Phytoplasma melaleucae TaxID=2982630 RepID=A0ABT9DCP4_9MOLU|nr:peptide chain release factor 2 ['Melaleuca sp.' phytoplasma]MDO8167885.1 peptide chain release factor 2 ['Melaleuca sp.' phytoplasma]MDV3205208.1 peptide chain release factor 2 [Weeping tea tree witches'-broom phytoplasma]